jgi:hypothetical protein
MIYNSVTRWLREAKFPLSSADPGSVDVPRGFGDSDSAVLPTLKERPFGLVWQLSRLTHLPSRIVYRRLTQSLGFYAHHLRRVPHALSDAQKGANQFILAIARNIIQSSRT